MLKAGSLLKKKDILVGWQSRYFVVLPGRAEYYLDEHAYQTGQSPRATIQLCGANIVTSKLVTVNGGEHHAITVEPMARAKTFRVASEKPGGIGKDDIEMWGTELLRASTYGYNQSNNQYSQLPSTSRMTPNASTNNVNSHSAPTTAVSTVPSSSSGGRGEGAVPSSSSGGRGEGGTRMRPIAASSGLHIHTNGATSTTTTTTSASASATTNSTLSAATTSPSSSPSRSIHKSHSNSRQGFNAHHDSTSPDSSSSPYTSTRTRALTFQDGVGEDDNNEIDGNFPASEKAHNASPSSSSTALNQISTSLSPHKTSLPPSSTLSQPPTSSSNAKNWLLLLGGGIFAVVASYRATGVIGAVWCGMTLLGWCMLVYGVSWNKDKGLPTDSPNKRHKPQKEGVKASKGFKGMTGIETDGEKVKGGASRGKFKFLRQQQQQQQQQGDS